MKVILKTEQQIMQIISVAGRQVSWRWLNIMAADCAGIMEILYHIRKY